jgi:hypothetical protein
MDGWIISQYCQGGRESWKNPVKQKKYIFVKTNPKFTKGEIIPYPPVKLV